MTLPHVLNLGAHIGAGGIALALGMNILWRRKGDAAHRRMGRWFGWMAIVVTATATLGLLAFRFLPLFAVLTVLVGYQLYSGWRVAYTQGRGPAPVDVAMTFGTLGLAIALSRIALASAPQSRTVILSGVVALGIVLAYDVARLAFPARWHGVAWPLEHLYKLNGALFGMVSAFVGNTVRVWQPWSQLLPSVVGTLVIGTLMWRQLRRRP